MFAIFVTIRLKPGHADAFLQAILDDASGSVRDEPGCFRFDVHRDPKDPNRFHLYEVYGDRAAFESHMKTPHFERWRTAVSHMFDGEPVRVDMETVFPSADGWSAQKPGLLNW